MNREQLLLDLQQIPEMDPDKHDGCYELMRATIAAYSRADLSAITYLDLNAVYSMALISTTLNVEKKKEYVKKSALPEIEKDKLCELIDQVWDKACFFKYGNIEFEKRVNNRDKAIPIVGLFGSGFLSFKGKTTDECAREFIKMCLDILPMQDDNAIYDRCEPVLDSGFQGMRAASASAILHCLKPMTFPILNGNMGNDNIYLALGIEINTPEKLTTYIGNARKIKAFRDANLPFKNYRILDIEARNLSKYDEEFEPSLKEYNPGITKEKWLELLNDGETFTSTAYYTMAAFYLVGGTASCAQLEQRFGKSADLFRNAGTQLASKVLKKLNIPKYQNYGFFVVFLGRNAKKGELGNYVWKVRPELMEALVEFDITRFIEEGSDVGVDMNNQTDKNLILYGPPGTGKTYYSVLYAVAICDNKDIEELKLQDYQTSKTRFDQLKDEGRIVFTTFHQSYGYEEFIEGIRPVMGDEGGSLNYEIRNGVFKELCVRAKKTSDPYVLIIDEINRGNISKIFGELITLIEDTKRQGSAEEMEAVLPYSGETFSVPENVYLIGTMNTADRSIALMDTALRRRFSFIEMMPDSKVLTNLGITTISVDGDDLNVATMLDVINNRIAYLFDREHTIGHAFFTELKDSPTIETLAGIFEKKVIPLLQEYFYEDYEKIQLVLGDNAKEDEYKFIRDNEIKVKNIFNGNPDIDLPEKGFEIQREAFMKLQSYKQISKDL